MKSVRLEMLHFLKVANLCGWIEVADHTLQGGVQSILEKICTLWCLHHRNTTKVPQNHQFQTSLTSWASTQSITQTNIRPPSLPPSLPTARTTKRRLFPGTKFARWWAIKRILLSIKHARMPCGTLQFEYSKPSRVSVRQHDYNWKHHDGDESLCTSSP